MNKFSLDTFKMPPKDNNVVLGWFWNSPITKESIDYQLTECAKAGIGGMYIIPAPIDFRPETSRTFLFPQYLTDDFFDMVEYAIKKAKDLGMEIWLYDEGGWPSGGACGNTARENPESVETVLHKNDVTIFKGELYKLTEDKTAFVGCEQVTEDFIAQEETVVSEYHCKRIETTSPNRVDTTNPGVVDTFIHNTYEKYYNRLKSMFGSDISLFFTDEPPVISNIIPKNFFELFRNEYGYDVKGFLPVIMDECMAVTEKQQRARIDYARLVGKLFYENFCKKLADWCDDHNIRFGGHLDHDHLPDGGVRHIYFSQLHALSAFAVPGIDVIWHQIRCPYDGASPVPEGSLFYPRIAPSAARQTGKNFALTETFGVYGDALTQDEMRYVLNYQAIRGINVFNVFGLTSTDERLGALVERPVFTPKKPGFYNMSSFYTYYSRLSYLLRLGEAVCETALYHPSGDFWANGDIRTAACVAYNNTGNSLEEKNVYFDIIDDYGIESAQITPEGLKLGNAVYKRIKVPECRFMPENVKEKITPYLGEGAPLLNTQNAFLRVMARKVENGTLWFIFNQGEETVEEILDIQASNLYKINIQCGEIYKTDRANISLVCGDIAVFFATDETYSCDSEETEYSVEVGDFKPVEAKQFVIDHLGIHMEAVEVPQMLEKEFSGEITYEASYRLPKAPQTGEKYRIILENTAVSASVRIDGKKVADFGMTPMVAVIDGDKIASEGKIEITIANTAANEIIAKCDVINAYPLAEVGPYHKMSLPYEAKRPELRLGKLKIEKEK